MKKYFIDGKQVTKTEADQIKYLNALYFHIAENGNFEALNKIVFIVEI